MSFKSTLGSVFVLVFALLLGFLKYRRLYVGPSGFGFATTAEDVVKGTHVDKTVFITGMTQSTQHYTRISVYLKITMMAGATSGLGQESARVLAEQGAEVYLCGRSLEKATSVVHDLYSHKMAQAKAIYSIFSIYIFCY